MSGGVPAGELLPCPFCGGEASCDDIGGMRALYTVGCNNSACDADAHFTGWDGYEPLIALWNTRSTYRGWKLVPVAPTDEMCKAGWIYADRRDAILDEAEVGALYAAMLAAVPATPTPPIEGRDADVERVREALERSVTALNDWLHVYAPEFCGDDHVAESRARIGEYGTLAYIAHVQEKNRAALQALGERG